MLDIDLTRSATLARLDVRGELVTADDVDTLVDMVNLVPQDQHLVIDLCGVATIGNHAAQLLHVVIADRGPSAEVVVVAKQVEVRRRLVMANVDRIAPVVDTVADADRIVRTRTGLLTSAV